MTRSRAAQDFPTARPFLPPGSRSLREHAQAAQSCRGCDLYRDATQAVFGEGPRKARVVIVGEKPGDQEDRSGHPFVGPAGRILDRALLAAGIPRDEVYVTNAVKHFKWKAMGKRRLHQKPSSREIAACRPWLEREIQIIRPKVIICLGASAARAVFGHDVTIRDVRGKILESELCRSTLATVHPSALLRIPEAETRHFEFERLVGDLSAAWRALHAPAQRTFERKAA